MMIYRKPLIAGIFLSLGLLVSSGLWAEPRRLPTATPASVGMSDTGLQRVSDTLQRFVDEKKVAGTVTLILREGKIVYFEAMGHREIESEKQMERDSVFRIYSMTKPIVSVAAMMLVEEEKLLLDEPIATYVPEFKKLKVFDSQEGDEIRVRELKNPPTIRDLLRHTSGLTYGLFGNSPVDQAYRRAGVLSPGDSLQTMVEKLAGLPLMQEPQTKFTYSVSTDVLGHVIEVVTKQRLGDFLAERIFKPLGMIDTAFQVHPDALGRFTTVYSPTAAGGLSVNDAAQTSEFTREPAMHSGGGGLVSTARDYGRFCQMILNGGQLDGQRLLGAETVAAMTRNHLAPSAMPIAIGAPRPGVGFGLGVSVVVEKPTSTSKARVGEIGWGGMASTHFWISKKDELAVVVLSQRLPYSDQLEKAIKPLVYAAIE